MIETQTDFPLLGDRDYINGATLLEGFLAALENAGATGITLKRLKFQRTAGTNGRLVLDADPIDRADDASCVLSAAAGATAWRGAFFEEGRAPERRPAPPCTVTDLKAEAFAGECDIEPASRAGLIYDIVQANKRIHEQALGREARPTVRFGYVENWTAPERNVAFSTRLRVENLIRKKTARGWLTVNRISYAAPHTREANLLVCFEVSAT